jgi:hypothetical protein
MFRLAPVSTKINPWIPFPLNAITCVLALRKTESWVFGIEDDFSEVEDVRYIDNDRVPGVPRAWLDARDLTKYANVAVSG